MRKHEIINDKYEKKKKKKTMHEKLEESIKR